MTEQDFQIRVEVSIANRYGNQMRLSEDYSLDNVTFHEMSELLARFHELFETIKHQRTARSQS